MSRRCEGCGERTTAAGAFCRTCQRQLGEAKAAVKKQSLLVDQAGGSWWVWSPRGEVLTIGKPTRQSALLSLVRGDDEEPPSMAPGTRSA
jgi:hypothetical protein